MSHVSRLTLASSLIALLLAGCGSDSPMGSGGSGGSDTGGTGGMTATGGTGGTATGGSGGSVGTGGSGTGGMTATGGTGGTATGGMTGTGGSVGTGGMTGTGGSVGTGGMTGTGGTGGVTLDQCFANMPALSGSYQIATKASADGGTRIRVALLVDGFGTSGTKAWKAVRFAFERGINSACVTDETQLKYTTSHHNCTDKMTATAAGITYAIAAPDRPTATVAATGAAAFPTVTVMNTACKSSDMNKCGSGGPCQ